MMFEVTLPPRGCVMLEFVADCLRPLLDRLSVMGKFTVESQVCMVHKSKQYVIFN